MLAALARLRDSLMQIGARPTDRPEQRVRKATLVITAATITALATVWTLTYLLLGRPLAAAAPATYQVISLVGLAYFARTGNFGPFRFSQLASMLVLPFILQWTLGGFVNSSAIMIWAFASPLAALVLSTPREALAYFAGYAALTIGSGAIDPIVAAGAVPLPSEVRLLFFVLNIGTMSAVVYVVLQYFVAARQRAQRETDALLHNILPEQIADRLKSGEGVIADDHPAVTVLFADLAGFTALARSAGADEVLAILNRLFTAFDELAERHGLEKIKTIGDAYMAVAGAPQARPDHAMAAADMALGMVDAAAACSRAIGRQLTLRIGIHTGPAMAGVIGRRKFAYDLWGDAVNVASRMETHGVPGRIQVTEAVVSALDEEYLFEERGTIEVKGLGDMRTFFLLARAPTAGAA